MKHTLPGQLDLPECPPDTGYAQRLASARMVPARPQLPCDHGLFSDEAAQVDLIEMLQEPVNGHD